MKDRYSRQELFSPIGKQGQSKITNKHVLIIGAGALGTGNAEALVRSGVGRVTIVDRDYVEWSNLGRQSLYSEEDAKQRLPKAVAAENRLRQINSNVKIKGIVADVSVDEIASLVEGVSVLIDATDNFETRFIINDASHKFRIPWIYGACVGSYGLTYTVIPGKKPCLHCLLQTVPMGGETCDTVGIIAPTVGMVVSYQVTEALKLLVEDYDSLRDTMVTFDLWKNQINYTKVSKLKRSDCPTCGKHPTYPYLNALNHTRTAVLCGRDTVQLRPPVSVDRDLGRLKELFMKDYEEVQLNPYLLSVNMGEWRLVIFKDGRILVHGTKDIALAKSIYNRYFG